MNVVSLGLTLIAIGILLFALIFLFIQGIPLVRARRKVGEANVFEDQSAEEIRDEMLLIVKPGGRLVYLDDQVRRLFGLSSAEKPGLERLARQIRPAEQFLMLGAIEGQVNLSFYGRQMMATSHWIVHQSEPAMLIVIRSGARAQRKSDTENNTVSRGWDLRVINEVSSGRIDINDLESIIKSILINLDEFFNADFVELALFDSNLKVFHSYRLGGEVGTERWLEKLNEPYQINEGLVGDVAQRRQPVHIERTDKTQDLGSYIKQPTAVYDALMGVPLNIENELLGVLVFASTLESSFQENVLQMAVASASMVSVLLQDVYASMQRGSLRYLIEGVSQLTSLLADVNDPKNLYSQLVHHLSTLIPVQVLGFLIYNESDHTLEGKVPFQGMPPQFVEVYRVTILPNMAAEKILLEHRPIITENASEDNLWEEIGMQHLARAASIRDAILQPLVSGGRLLGYLQAANHTNGSTFFTAEELQMIRIAANQSAAMIENATLAHQTRVRAQRSEMLRRISNMVGTAVHTDDLIRMVLSELNHHLHLDIAAAFILDTKTYRLQLHQPSLITVYNLSERNQSLLVDDAQYLFTVTGSQHSYIYNHLSEDNTLIPFYRQIVTEWKAESALVVPMVAGDETIGEIWLASMRADYFDQSELQLANIVSTEIAGVIRQERLASQTDAGLRERTDQLVKISQIEREMITILDLSPLLETIYDQALQLASADCGQLCFFASQESSLSEELEVVLTRGEAFSGQFGHLEMTVIENQRSAYLPDLSQKADYRVHEGIASLVVLPIVSQQKTLALLTLHSKQMDHFASLIEALEIFLAHAAIALENAMHYDAINRRLDISNEELDIKEKLIQIGQSLRPNRPLQEALNDVCSIIQSATSFQAVYVLVYDAAIKQVRRVSQASTSISAIEQFIEKPQPWQRIQALLKTEYKHGRSFRIPRGSLLDSSAPTYGEVVQADGARDILLLPLFTADRTPLGVIIMGDPQSGQFPGWATIRALDLFSIQVSMIIDSNRYITALAASLSEVEVNYGRLLQSSANSQQRVSMLLHKELEQVLINRSLARGLSRNRLLPEIIETTDQQRDAQSLLHTITEALLLHFNFKIGLVGLRNRSQVNLLEVVGSLPEHINPETWMGQQNPLRQTLTDGVIKVIKNIQDESAEWSSSLMIKTLDVHSFVALPFVISPDESAAILLISDRSSPGLMDEDLHLFERITNLISGRLHHLQTLNETVKRLNEVNLLLDFTQNLNLPDESASSLTPDRILSLLLDTLMRVVPSAQAGWVGMWDMQEQCISPVAVTGFVDAKSFMRIKFRDNPDFAENLLPIQVYYAGIPFRADEIHFAHDYRLPTNDLMLYDQATNQRVPESGMLIPFRQGEKLSGILVLDNYEVDAAFSDQDEMLALSLLHQAVLVLENVRLFNEAEERTNQLRNLTNASGIISSSLSTDELLEMMLHQLKSITPFDTATLWMREEDELVIESAAGFADNQNRLGLKVSIEDSILFREILQTGDAILAPDIRLDHRFPALLEPENLCWLGIPLKTQSKLLGMIALEKKEAGFYSVDQVQILKTFAGQAVAALENARLYEESEGRAVELNLRTQRLSILDQLSSELGALIDVDAILKATAQQLLTALNVSSIGVAIDEDNELALTMHIPFSRLIKLPLKLVHTTLFENLKESKGIFITNNLSAEDELMPIYDQYFAFHGTRSLLVIPLIITGRVYGWLLAQNNIPYRFNMQEIELARTICNQASLAIQKATLLEETRRLSADLERRVIERTAELQKEHQYTEALLRITTELSSSLETEQVLGNTLSILNESLGAEQSLILLSDGTSRHYDSGAALIDLAKAAEQPFAFETDQAMINLFLHKYEPMLVTDILHDDRFEVENKDHLSFLSAIAVPLILTDQVIGTLLLINRQTEAFNQDHVRLAQAAARQVSVAMNNAELYEISNEQANRLIEMLRNEEIASSQSLAILEAVADGVLVTDSDNIITLFNNSAERILDLPSNNVLGKGLDEFFDFFGDVTTRWMETIQRWSSSPNSFQSGDSYSEQLNLKNNRVVMVSLAPVIMGEVFLGTVSIFRDITHQIQVDRLKSEFVANVSHELRTPMTSIKGYVDILLMGAAGEITPQQGQFLHVVKSNAERLGILVNDLLDVSRIEAGRAVLSYKTVNLMEIAYELVESLKTRSQDNLKPLDIQISVPSELPVVRGDPDRIQQVVNSLLVNAYNYTPAGGRIKLQMRTLDDSIRVDVVDNGIGIPAKDQHRIFERFYRGEDPLVLATAGTGLGLAISRILVEMHGGKIWFESSGIPGEGSVFSFTLPIYRSEE